MAFVKVNILHHIDEFICNLFIVEEKHEVIHQSFGVSVSSSETIPVIFYELNIKILLNLLNSCVDYLFQLFYLIFLRFIFEKHDIGNFYFDVIPSPHLTELVETLQFFSLSIFSFMLLLEFLS